MKLWEDDIYIIYTNENDEEAEDIVYIVKNKLSGTEHKAGFGEVLSRFTNSYLKDELSIAEFINSLLKVRVECLKKRKNKVSDAASKELYRLFILSEYHYRYLRAAASRK